MGPDPLDASGTIPGFGRSRSSTIAGQMSQSKGWVEYQPDTEVRKGKIGIYLRTKPEACYFSQSTKLNVGWEVGYLLKFVL